MRQLILTSRHWQIFIAFLAMILLAEYLVDIISNLFSYDFLSNQYRATRILLTTPVVLSYPLLAGFGLDDKLKDSEKFQRTTNWRLLALTVIFLATYLLAIFSVDNDSIIFYGLSAINIASFVSLSSFPARRLKSIELKRNAGIWEYTPEAFQFLCWPLGVWWTQPRINRIATNDTVITNE